MPSLSTSPVLLVSVAGNLADREALTRGCQLAQALAERDLSATWTTSRFSALAEHEEFAPTGPQEIALWADKSWLNGEHSRGRLAAQLDTRLIAAREYGYQPTTLWIEDQTRVPDEMNDLLVRQGISALRSASTSLPASGWFSWLRRPAPVVAAQWLCWGLWQLEPTLDAEQQSLRSIRRQAIRGLQSGAIVHVSLSLADLAHATSSTVQRWADMLHGVSQAARCDVLSVGALVARQQQSRQARSAGSILRRAA